MVALIERALGEVPARIAPLAGGCVGEVYRVELRDGSRLVAKVDERGDGALDVEGWMLRYLGAHAPVPVPEVVHAAPDCLVMTWLPGTSAAISAAEEHAGELIAALHAVTAERFGLERDTRVGGLHQPNPPSEQWLPFFRDQRLRSMARAAHDAGRLDANTLARIDRLAARLDSWLAEPAAPSLLHGDLWSGNVLADGGRITGLIDPAIYFGHAEAELAFTTLFGTFGARFFAAYRAHGVLAPGFFEERRDLYNLYPLLVHVRLFGGGYADDVRRTLRRYGC